MSQPGSIDVHGIPVPTAVFMPFGPRVTIYAFGRAPAGQMINWSIAKNPDVGKYIAEFALKNAGVTEILSPRPDFSGRICTREELTVQLENIVGRCEVSRILRHPENVSADGVEIKPGQAFYIASGDCPTLVVFDPIGKRLIAAHAGRDCLWDREHVLNDKTAREHASIVDAAMLEFDDVPPEELKAFIACGIAAKNFSHSLTDPNLKSKNLEMIAALEKNCPIEFMGKDSAGCINLREIIRSQLISHGLRPDAIGCDAIDTYGDTDSTGEHYWWSNRRGDKTVRNGVLVIYND
jgi:copper oxidase (laccase) domain-containing protein